MPHFLKASIAKRFGCIFAGCSGLHMEGMQFQQLITAWWKNKPSHQLQGVLRATPTILMGILGKGRNNIKNGG